MPKNRASKQRFYEAAVEIWEEFDEGLLEKLAGSMPARLQAVINAQG